MEVRAPVLGLTWRVDICLKVALWTLDSTPSKKKQRYFCYIYWCSKASNCFSLKMTYSRKMREVERCHLSPTSSCNHGPTSLLTLVFALIPNYSLKKAWSMILIAILWSIWELKWGLFSQQEVRTNLNFGQDVKVTS